MRSTARLVTICCLLAACAGSARAEAGWHGETMPAGMSRGAVQGEYRWEQDGRVMVYVPATRFIMGSSERAIANLTDAASGRTVRDMLDEAPLHVVTLGAYYIDKYEVTWDDYLHYCERTGADRPPVPRWFEAGSMGTHPVVRVSWDEAVRFATVHGKQLPSEAQWELAARGHDHPELVHARPFLSYAAWAAWVDLVGRRDYPWGSNLPGARQHWLNAGGDDLAEDSWPFTAPVGSFEQDRSVYGCMDLAGNVQEWVLDSYQIEFYASEQARGPDPVCTASSPYNVVRGGAYELDVRFCRLALRFWSTPASESHFVGFRTVVPAR